jgi:pimeloyl-ACP methyl ester carboxylesterase
MIKSYVYNGKEKIAYNDFGNIKGFPILIQHGAIASIKDVDLFEKLEPYARIICIARPGYGESSPYILNNMLEYGIIISKLVEYLSIEKFDVLSSSAGAPYGYAIGKACQEKTRNIYVYSGTPALYDEEVQKYWPFPISKDLTIEECQKTAYEAFFSGIPESALNNNAIKDSMANNCFGEAQNIRIRFKDWGFKLSEINSKVFIQHSKKDGPYRMVLRTVELLPNCELELLEEGEHFTKEGYESFIEKTIIKEIKK